MPSGQRSWKMQLEDAFGAPSENQTVSPVSKPSALMVLSGGMGSTAYSMAGRVAFCNVASGELSPRSKAATARRRATWGHLLMEDGCCTHLEHLPNVFAVVVAFVVAAVPGFCIAAAVVVVNPC
jgi:hypothetical protein